MVMFAVWSALGADSARAREHDLSAETNEVASTSPHMWTNVE